MSAARRLELVPPPAVPAEAAVDEARAPEKLDHHASYRVPARHQQWVVAYAKLARVGEADVWRWLNEVAFAEIRRRGGQ